MSSSFKIEDPAGDLARQLELLATTNPELFVGAYICAVSIPDLGEDEKLTNQQAVAVAPNLISRWTNDYPSEMKLLGKHPGLVASTGGGDAVFVAITCYGNRPYSEARLMLTEIHFENEVQLPELP